MTFPGTCTTVATPVRVGGEGVGDQQGRVEPGGGEQEGFGRVEHGRGEEKDQHLISALSDIRYLLYLIYFLYLLHISEVSNFQQR